MRLHGSWVIRSIIELSIIWIITYFSLRQHIANKKSPFSYLFRKMNEKWVKKLKAYCLEKFLIIQQSVTVQTKAREKNSFHCRIFWRALCVEYVLYISPILFRKMKIKVLQFFFSQNKIYMRFLFFSLQLTNIML